MNTTTDMILDAVRRRNPPGAELSVSRSIPEFLGGELHIVDVVRDGAKVSENFFYDPQYGSGRTFATMDELALWISSEQQRLVGPRSGASSILGASPVAAGIAILITITICVLVIMQSNDPDFNIPDILANSLTTILGFYFGREVALRRERSAEITDQ